MSYPSKLLLFGEYTVVKGSQALALPLPLYAGRWAYAQDRAAIPFPLDSYAEYLNTLDQPRIDFDKFKAELERGLFFDSDIPIGYGLGSSGALCAAVYERFVKSPIPVGATARYGQLKAELAQLEGFFHGSSSGTDPLIAYLRRAVLLGSEGRIREVSPPAFPKKEGVFFLIDTGIARQTGPLVQLFLAYCQEETYLKAVERDLMPLNEQAVEQYLRGDWSALWLTFGRISALQYDLFQAMIPEAFRPVWQQGLSSQAYRLKLCGAGGGGFILGWRREVALPDALAGLEIVEVLEFGAIRK